MKSKVYVGDIGTDVILDVGQDITGATVSIAVRKPSGATVDWPSAVYSATAVRHTTVAGDLDVPGAYRVQPVVALSSGDWSGRGETAEFLVYDHQQ